MTEKQPISDDDVQSMLDELNGSGKGPPPLWRWTQAGDYVAGTLVKAQMKDTPMRELRQLLSLRQSDGSLINVFVLHKVLREELAKVNPNIGDDLLIRYNGERRSAKGREFHHYSVVHRPKQPSLDFSEGETAGPSRQRTAPTANPGSWSSRLTVLRACAVARHLSMVESQSTLSNASTSSLRTLEEE
jgi:hypothetical protein